MANSPTDEDVDIGVYFIRKQRRERIVRLLATGLVPIPKIAKKFGVSRQAIYSIAKRAERRGEIERLPGIWPNTYRPGPNFPENPIMGHDAPHPKRGTLPVRFHALQAKVPVDLRRADLSAWTSWDTTRGRMYATALPTRGRPLRVQIRGSAHPILVVSIPSITMDVPYGEGNSLEMHISNAIDTVKRRVFEETTLAIRTCREKYGVVTTGLATWYRQPEIAIERFPSLPAGVRYRIAYVWVDSSPGHTEVETDSIPALQELMAIANRVSLRLSMSTFSEITMMALSTIEGPESSRPDNPDSVQGKIPNEPAPLTLTSNS